VTGAVAQPGVIEEARVLDHDLFVVVDVVMAVSFPLAR
jgi:hypothetical protein